MNKKENNVIKPQPNTLIQFNVRDLLGTLSVEGHSELMRIFHDKHDEIRIIVNSDPAKENLIETNTSDLISINRENGITYLDFIGDIPEFEEETLLLNEIDNRSKENQEAIKNLSFPKSGEWTPVINGIGINYRLQKGSFIEIEKLLLLNFTIDITNGYLNEGLNITGIPYQYDGNYTGGGGGIINLPPSIININQDIMTLNGFRITESGALRPLKMNEEGQMSDISFVSPDDVPVPISGLFFSGTIMITRI